MQKLTDTLILKQGCKRYWIDGDTIDVVLTNGRRYRVLVADDTQRKSLLNVCSIAGGRFEKERRDAKAK